MKNTPDWVIQKIIESALIFFFGMKELYFYKIWFKNNPRR
ncbi:hypothetical protein PULV_a2554 [Pseudoalteromonas ulvae UL12]|nr:hypothetical protein [Pseudoalteromonas ulvae UL12]